MKLGREKSPETQSSVGTIASDEARNDWASACEPSWATGCTSVKA